MAKKYQPSGYQIIVLNVESLDNGDVLPQDTDDEKLLYSLFDSGNNLNKPLLLKVINFGDTLIGIATVGKNAITIAQLILTSGAIDSCVSYDFIYDGSVIRFYKDIV